MKLLDSHCHLDLLSNMSKLVQDIASSDLSIISMTTTPKAYKKNKEICEGVENIKIALGLHPQLVSQRENEIDILFHYLKETRFVGEIGIDLNSNYKDSIEKQIRIFMKIIDLCDLYGNKVISIHSVKSVGLILEILRMKSRNDDNKFILHWFSGNNKDLEQAINQGLYFSINSKMINTYSGCNTIKRLPIDKVLLETDAPFIKDIVSVNNIFNELNLVINRAANIKGIDNKELIKRITENSAVIWGES